MSYPYKLHFGSRPRPESHLGRGRSTVVRADGLPLWSRGVPRVSGLLSGADLRVLLSSSPPSLSSICNLPFASVFMPLAKRVDPEGEPQQWVHGAKASTEDP